jgi:hypothetical protein
LTVNVERKLVAPPTLAVPETLANPVISKLAVEVLPDDKVLAIVTAPLTVNVERRFVAPPTLAVPETLAKPVIVVLPAANVEYT